MSRVDTRHVRTSTRVLTVCLGSAACWASVLFAQQLPSGATPGGVLPRVAPAVQSSPQQGELFTIPGVAERPLGADEGPRLVVKSFKLIGVNNRAEYGIREADVQRLLQGELQKQPAEGLTVNQLQALAGTVADFYHAKGLILAQAFVPAQEVRDSQVTVEVLEGRLSGIKLEGNKSYSKRLLLRPFNPLMGQPVDRKSIESALLTLTDYPGITAFGILGAGHDVGTTNLTLRVQNERRVTAESSVDNHGSQFAGEYRGQLALGFNNLLGDADRLRIYGLYGYEPGDTHARGTYGGINYEIPLFSPRDSVLLSYSTNSYDIGRVSADIAATNPKGKTGIGELGYRHDLAPSRLGSASFGLALDVKRATFDESGQELFKDDLTTARVNFAWDRTDTRFRGVNQFEIAYVRGFKNWLGAMGDYNAAATLETIQASRFGASGEFGKGTLSAQRLQRITTNSSLLLRVQGQFSSDRLVSLEQLSLGGPDAVRAYPIAEGLIDSGAIGTAELIFGAPGIANRPAFANRTWGQVLQFSLFIDYGHGILNKPNLLGVQDHFNLGGWGGAVQFNVPSRVFFRVDVAKPMTSFAATNGRDPQYFFRLGVSF